MPSRVTDMNPNGLYNYLQAEKLNIEPLGQGVNKGISFSEGGGYNVHFNSSIILIVVIIMEYHIIKYHQAIYLNIQVKRLVLKDLL